MLGITNYWAFCLAVLVFLALPGPGTFAVLTSTGKGGLRGGFASLAGIMLGDWLLMIAAMLGVAAILQAHPAVFKAVQWLGVAYLVWVGLQLVFAKQGSANATILPVEHGKFFRQSFFITLINPKAIVFYMAFFPLFIDPSVNDDPSLLVRTFLAMAVSISVITLFYGGALVLVGNAIARAFSRNRTVGRIATKLAGVCLIGFGVKLWTN
jgi:threonine/homoserine/homoserine lactone efflux protein